MKRKTRYGILSVLILALFVCSGCKTGGAFTTNHYDVLYFPVNCGVVRKQQVVKAIQDGEIETLNGNKPVSGTASAVLRLRVSFDNGSTRKVEQRNEEIVRMVKASVASAQARCPDADALIDVTTVHRVETTDYGLYLCVCPVAALFSPVHTVIENEFTTTGTPIKITTAHPGKPAEEEEDAADRLAPVERSAVSHPELNAMFEEILSQTGNTQTSEPK